MDPRSRSARLELALAQLANRQHGVVARRQLLALGLSATMIRNRRRQGRLLALPHRGVYAVGHRQLRSEGIWLAAVLAVGPGARLSHRDAAALHRLRAPEGGRVDVTVVGDARSTEGIRVHGTTALCAEDVTIVAGIPVTSVARTLVDLAGVVSERHLAAAIAAAERDARLDVRAIERVLDRTRGRNGRSHAAMRAALGDLAAHGAQMTRSELEQAFLALLVAYELPRPRTNVRVHGHEVDALWPEHRLVVELDGWAFHRTRRDFERDRATRAELQTAGYRVVAFSSRQVMHRPQWVVAQVRALLR